MAVAIFADVQGQTPEKYDGMMAVLESEARKAPGFVMHSAYATEEGGWKVIEIWESSKQANDFFARHIHPHLPPGVRPRRTFQELYSLVRP